MINNPYIEKVRNHEKILFDLEKIYSHKGKWGEFFGNDNPIYLEIGTGLGNFFSKQVIQNKSINYIGMEIKYKRLYKTAEKSLGNIKNNANLKDNIKPDFLNDNFIILKDFSENIDKIFSQNEVSLTYIFFPDPWDKKINQAENKLLKKTFLDNLHKITKKGGKLILKTDNKNYFDYILGEIGKTDWKIEIKTYDYEKSGLYDDNAVTEFEQIFRGQDIKVCYLELEK